MDKDVIFYFENICNKMKNMRDQKFLFCLISGINSVEDVLSNYKKYNNFFALNNTNDGQIFKNGGGFFNKKMYTIFLLKKYKLMDMEDRISKIQECRIIFNIMTSQLIRDKNLPSNQNIYLDTERIPYYELSGYEFAGCTGIYFNITIHECYDLRYDNTQWNE